MLPLAAAPGGRPQPREWPRSIALWLGSTAIVLAAVGVGWAVVKPPAAVPAQASAIGDLPGGNWSVDPGSEIRFSGAHAGMPFEGRFTLGADRSFLLEGSLAPRGNTPPPLVRSLELLGPPDANGRRPVSISGTL